MSSIRVLSGVCLFAAQFAFVPSAMGTVYSIILRGTVVMEDGSAPPFTAGTERICSDNAGSAPGPLTNKKGEFIWRMEIDPLATRECYINATHAGYTSSTLEVQGLDTTKTEIKLPPLVLNSPTADPYAIIVSESALPSKSKSSWNAAMKALDAPDFAEALRQLQAVTAASPKFAQGWHALGVVAERQRKPDEAREAYQHAIEADPRLLPAYVTLARLCIKTKDWQGAVKTADALIKADPKHSYPEIYLHRAVAQYQLKDLDDAAANVQEALRLDSGHKRPRAWYVLGRILEAKGDANGAKDNIVKYLQLAPNAPDVDLVRGHLQNLGKPEAASVDPELEPL